MLNAFSEEFSDADNVCLAIRSSGLDDQLTNFTSRNHGNTSRDRSAKIIKVKKVSMKEYPSFFKSADAFILPTHGEG